MTKRFFNDYLNFTRKERTGIIVILVLIIVFLLLPFFYPYFIARQKYDHSQFQKEIQSLNIQQQDSSGHYALKFDESKDYDQPYENNYYQSHQKGELFYFDPNTLTAAGWQRLGIREKTALTIQKYISKGGRFYKPEDIGKIWGLHKNEVSRLLPYVRIQQQQAANYVSTEIAPKLYEKPKPTITIIDVNSADTSALIALPGIGSKLAARIIAFREKLGGFYKVEQVGETYGLPDSTFQKIKSKLVIGNPQVKKLDINRATADEMKAHPYLRYNIANAIVQYRTAHGSFSKLTDLKNIMIITNEIYNKVVPYLTLD